MADPASGLGRPDAQGDGESASHQYGPADPGGLPGKPDQGKKRH